MLRCVFRLTFPGIPGRTFASRTCIDAGRRNAMKTQTTENFQRVLLWGPRILGLVVALYFGMFALDAFTGDKSWSGKLGDFIVHAAPAMFILLTVLVSWRRFWIGTMVFSGLALYYALTTLDHPDWILAISGPLLLVGILYGLNWWKKRG